MSVPLSDGTYKIDVTEFPASDSAGPVLQTDVGYAFVSTSTSGNQEQRYLLQSWDRHKFRRPPRRAHGLDLRSATLTTNGGTNVTTLTHWATFATERFVTGESVYVKVSTAKKLQSDSGWDPLPTPASGDYPAYMSPAPPTGYTVMQNDVGAFILRWKLATGAYRVVGYGLGAADGLNQYREIFVLTPATASGFSWPASDLRWSDGDEMPVAELVAWMNEGASWRTGSQIVLCSCRYYDAVQD